MIISGLDIVLIALFLPLVQVMAAFHETADEVLMHKIFSYEDDQGITPERSRIKWRLPTRWFSGQYQTGKFLL